MRLLLLVIVVASASRVEADCERSCPATDKDMYGCCPPKAPKTPTPGGTTPAITPMPIKTPAPPQYPLAIPDRDPAPTQVSNAARDAIRNGDRAKLLRCGDDYLTRYNRDPNATDADELLYESAGCFAKASSIGSAILFHRLLQRSYPKSTRLGYSLLKSGQLYAQIAYYAEAAERFEEYAKRFGAEVDAPIALRNAIYYRTATGDDAKAIEDTALFIKQYGRKQPLEAARAHFALAAIFERRRDLDALLKQLDEYLKVHAAAGGIDLAIAAHSKLGQVRWDLSCPIRAVDGVCVKMTRAPAIPGKFLDKKNRKQTVATSCGLRPTTKTATVARKAFLVRYAGGHLKQAIALYEKAGGQTGGDEKAARRAYFDGKTLEADAELETFLGAMTPTTGDPKQLIGWVSKTTKVARTLTARYQGVIGLKDGPSGMRAWARIGQLSQLFGQALLGAELPVNVRGDASMADHYCDQIEAIAAPLERDATDAYQACLTSAWQLSISNESTSMCARELGEIRPADFPTTSEVVAPPVFAWFPVDLEDAHTAPVKTPRLSEGIADFGRQRAWLDADCTRLAKRFETAATGDEAAIAHYMAGLSYHRCNKTVDAEREYQIAAKAPHAAAISNLGTLYFKTGKVDSAKQYWETALKTNPKLIGARTNLAARELEQMRKLEPRDATWKKLDEDARFQLSSALAVDPSHMLAYLTLALVYLEGADQNHNRFEIVRVLLDEAKRRDDRFPGLYNLYGVLAYRMRDTAGAWKAFDTARALDDGFGQSRAARLNTALLALQLRRHDDAQRELAAFTKTAATAYDWHVAYGVAARWQKKPTDAEREYTAAIKLDPKRPEAYFNLGLLLKDVVAFQTSDLKAALAAYRRAVDQLKRAEEFGTGPIAAEAARQVADAIAVSAEIEKKLRANP